MNIFITTIKNIIISARPHYWIKNLLVFSVLLFSGNLFNYKMLLPVLFTFIIFNFITSSIYILNDIVDVKSDSISPLKKSRPIANGSLSKKLSLTVSIIMALTLSLLSFFINIYLGIIIISYIILNILYSFFLKKIIILDVFILSIGFFLRLIAGGAVVDIMPSYWLILCTLFLSLFFGFSKRYYELIILSSDKNKYRNRQFLQISIYIFATISIIIYTLYAVSSSSIATYSDIRLIMSLPFVIFGILRYIYINILTERVTDPITLLYKDKFSLINLGLWFISIFYLIYFY